MTPEQAVNLLISLSQKMTGLTVAECRHFDMALDLLKKSIEPQPPTPAPVSELPKVS